MTKMIDFQTDPSKYRHWRVAYDGDVANLYMDVDETGRAVSEGYELKLNSYDLGVSISNSPTSSSACGSNTPRSRSS